MKRGVFVFLGTTKAQATLTPHDTNSPKKVTNNTMKNILSLTATLSLLVFSPALFAQDETAEKAKDSPKAPDISEKKDPQKFRVKTPKAPDISEKKVPEKPKSPAPPDISEKPKAENPKTVKPKAAEPKGKAEPKDKSLEELKRDIERRKKALFEEKEALNKSVGVRPNKEFEFQDPYVPWDGQGLFREERQRLKGDLLYWTKKRDKYIAANKGFLDEEKEEALKDLEKTVEAHREALHLDKYWYSVEGYRGGSFLRYEYHRNRDFNKHVDDNDQRVPFRILPGLTLYAKDIGSITAIAAISRTWGANKARDRPQDHLDLYELYISPFFLHTDNYEITPKIGRQALRFGSERVLGDNNFFVFNRSFDALSINYTGKKLDWSLFAGRPVKRRDLNDRHGNDPDRRENLFGTYFTYKSSKKLTVELYALRKQNTRRFVGVSGFDPDTSTVFTGGGRVIYKGQRNESGRVVGINGELIYQRGRVNGDPHESAAAAWEITYSFLYDPLPEEMKEGLPPSVAYDADQVHYFQFALGVDWAKGDDSPGNRRSKTFQPVYPSPHLFQGSADVLGFQNLYDFHASMTFQFRGDVKEDGFGVNALSVKYHLFHRDSNESNVFGVNGAPIVAAPNGRGSHDVGQEVDVSIRVFKFFRVGYSRFFPGRYLRRNGLKDPVDYFYIAVGGR
ncbi:MAG: alginate export family protein [Planctomycetota bacterium]|nr:alginate export family protein [Planctomycetota bacterium]